MDKIFESFIAGIITHHPYVLPKGVTCKTQYHAGHLALDHRDNGLFKLKPDIVLFQNKACAVIDTKYTLLSDAKNYDNVSQSDVYQMCAYGAKTGADKIMLLYPDDGNSTYLNWKMEYDNGRRIDLFIRSVTLSIDLMEDIGLLIKQVSYYLGELCQQSQNFPITPK